MEFPPLSCGEVELLWFLETTGVLLALQVQGIGVLAMDLFQKAWSGSTDMTSSLSSSYREVVKLRGDEHMYVQEQPILKRSCPSMQ